MGCDLRQAGAVLMHEAFVGIVPEVLGHGYYRVNDEIAGALPTHGCERHDHEIYIGR